MRRFVAWRFVNQGFYETEARYVIGRASRVIGLAENTEQLRAPVLGEPKDYLKGNLKQGARRESPKASEINCNSSYRGLETSKGADDADRTTTDKERGFCRVGFVRHALCANNDKWEPNGRERQARKR